MIDMGIWAALINPNATKKPTRTSDEVKRMLGAYNHKKFGTDAEVAERVTKFLEEHPKASRKELLSACGTGQDRCLRLLKEGKIPFYPAIKSVKEVSSQTVRKRRKRHETTL